MQLQIPSPPPPPFPFASKPFFGLKDQLGVGVFCYCFRLLEAEPCLVGGGGQPQSEGGADRVAGNGDADPSGSPCCSL